MTMRLRKLFLIPVLLLALALVALPSGSRSAHAEHACWVEHIQCQEMYDCCCGPRATCTLSAWECQQFCGIWW
jgi:hypothetical protein